MKRETWEKMSLEETIENLSTYGNLCIYASGLRSPRYSASYENEVVKLERHGDSLKELIMGLRDNFED